MLWKFFLFLNRRIQKFLEKRYLRTLWRKMLQEYRNDHAEIIRQRRTLARIANAVSLGDRASIQQEAWEQKKNLWRIEQEEFNLLRKLGK